MRPFLPAILLIASVLAPALAEGTPPLPSCVLLPANAVLALSETGEPGGTWFFRYSFDVPDTAAAFDETISLLAAAGVVEGEGNGLSVFPEGTRLIYDCKGFAVVVQTDGITARPGSYDVLLAPPGG
jgi:hypothetical protein